MNPVSYSLPTRHHSFGFLMHCSLASFPIPIVLLNPATLVTYCDLFYISNLFRYFKTRKKNIPFNTETYLIEFEIGLILSKMYSLPQLNYIPHRDHTTPYYQKTIQILKEYKITLQELTKEKIRQIYNRLSYPDKRPSRKETFRWKVATSSILPNYLKIFNYRTVRKSLAL